MKLNADNFWSKKTYTLPTEIDYLYERRKKLSEYTIAQKVLGSTFIGAKQNASYFDILKEKVIAAQQMTLSETQKRTRQLNSLLSEAKGEGALNSEDDDLSDEAIEIQKQINFQAQVKFLQMYFDAYMAPKVSDIEWRLGKVTGTVLDTDMPSTGQVAGGLMYTRSAFSFSFNRKYWEYNWQEVGLKYNLSGIFENISNIHTGIKTSEELINNIVLNINPSKNDQYITSLSQNLNTIVNSISELNTAIISGKESFSGITNNIENNISGIISTSESLRAYLLDVNTSNVSSINTELQNLKNNFNPLMSGITTNLNSDPKIAKGLYNLNGIKQKKEYYSTLFFPPYKISPKNGIDEFTQYMNDIYSHNPEASFDIDSFLLRKQGFTYRDPGFKSLSDYINYLQWIIEGATGIVHTYLTEWDLSLYMQENLLSATINGSPLKLYLNYRIRQDNPLSSDEEIDVSLSSENNASTKLLGNPTDLNLGKYTDDRALVFNVAGSAVSKIDFDNNKLWRPSDFPLSVWWMPYLRERDWNMKVFHVEDYMLEKNIPYMDIYDTVNSQFAYDSASLKDIFKNQDYLGIIMGIWPNFDMKYFSAFYSSPLDGHSDFDVKVYGDLQKVAGADYGEAARKRKSLDDFIKIAKKEMLLNEGYYGTISSIAGQATRRDYIDGGSSDSDSEKMTMSSMASKRDSKANSVLADIDLDQPFASGKGKAQDMLTTGLNNQIDASSMTNFTGMNRFAPALFGGPHGSDYNPSTIQAYFDPNSQLLRNIARIETSQARDDEGNAFRSSVEEDFYQGLNAHYDNGTYTGMSPAKGLGYLVKGITIYTVNYSYKEVVRTREWVEVPDIVESASKKWPTKTAQGYAINYYVEDDQRLVNLDDKRIYKIQRRRIPYVNLPFSYNDLLIRNGRVIYEKGKYWLEYDAHYKLASYSEMALVPFRKYIFHDEPNVHWEIVQHKFEKYTADNSPSGKYWNEVRLLLSQYANNEIDDYQTALNNLTKKYKPVFVLKFWQDQLDSTEHTRDPEKKIRELLLEQNRNGIAPTLFFLEGNENFRFETGPASIFKATCSIEYYKDVQENFVETNYIFFKKKKKVGESYKYHEFIKVDIPSAELIADDLQFSGYSNKNESGVQTPMHLNSTLYTDKDTNFHIMQKFKATNSVNAMIARKSKKVDKNSLGGILAIVAVAAMILFPLSTLALVVAAGAAVASAVVYNSAKKQTDKDYQEDPEGGKLILWNSSSYLRLSGYGILSQIQGLNPEAENISAKQTNYNYRNYLKVSGNNFDIPFKELAFKTHTYTSGEGEPASYSEQNMDRGLQKALLNIYIRPKFCIQKKGGIPRYNYVPLDTPIRNFLSVLLTQISYYQFVKSSLIGENQSESLVDFEILYKTLTTCVDKCILKASGLNSLNERVTPDRSHIYYDYWIEQIIQILYGTDIERLSKREIIKTELQNKIDIMQSSIDILHPLCLKNIEDWTFNEVLVALNHINAVKVIDTVGNLEKFLFGYLRILYYYRFFFIAKRFNKENGTMWIMRALESVLEFIVPTAPPSGPPPSPNEMTKREPIYNVAFYEIQNSTYAKQQAIINQGHLDPDRITKVYIRVQWCAIDDYERWIKYRDGEISIEYDEVVELVTPEGVTKYAFKPIDGYYTLISKEYLENDKNIKWNNLHPLDVQRTIEDYDTAQWSITWGDSPDLTPIRWNIFGEINVDNLLQYARESISPDELICLIEQGADFWTVSLPGSSWPRSEGFRSKIKIKQYTPINPEQLANDPMVNIAGPMAYTIYPITQQQERPYPGVSSDNPTMFKINSEGLGGY